MTDASQNVDSHEGRGDLPTQPDPRLQLEHDVEYARMRGEIASSLFGEPAASLQIGRFTVLDRLGAGGMGVVYAAYDDVLDRKVAVKVLRGAASDHGRERMLREARAMARLTHPNIVAVHEVGEHEGQVFLAMEFVRGRSLDQWIYDGERPHPWREVLEVFRKAGRGLAAAHEAGLVHRDFKPHNVILADDGAVKVLDFGLAFPSSGSERDEENISTAGSKPDGGRHAPHSLTQTGAMVGTPAYMAPEQLRAEPATAASDQFAFAVSLFEALHGQRPFPGKRLEQLIASVLDGIIEDPPNASTVPSWIRAVCRRGLAIEPEARFGSVATLLEALDRDPASTRRRWLLGSMTVGLAVAGGFGLAGLRDEPTSDPCQDVGSAIEATWNGPRRDRVRDGFLASGVSYAADTWSRIEPSLDEFAQRWSAATTDACVAHHRGRQSDAIFDLRTVCIDSAQAGFDAVLTLLADADPTVVQSAAKMAAGLPSLSKCGDLGRLTAAVPPPEDPEDAAQVAEIREQLARAHAQFNAGHYEQAMTLATAAHARAVAVDHAPVVAEAVFRQGAIWQETREAARSQQALDEALYTALSTGHNELAVESLAHRIYVLAELRGQPDEACDDGPLANALMARAPQLPKLRWLLANNLAVAHERAGQPDRAIELYEQALGHGRAGGDEGRLNTSAVLANQALLYLDRGQPGHAEAKGREALAMAEQVLGPNHPQIPLYVYPPAAALVYGGRIEQGRTLFERSVAYYEHASTPSPDVAQDLYMLTEVAMIRRDYERVQQLAERGLAILSEFTMPPITTLGLRHALGHAQIGLGDPEAGLATHQQALAIAEQALPNPIPDAAELAFERSTLAASHRAMADAYRRLDQPDAMRTHVTRALALERSVSGNDSIALIPILLHYSELMVETDDRAEAHAALEHIRRLTAQRPNAEAAALAPIQLAFGDLWRARAEPTKAVQAYEDAVAGFEQGYDPDHPQLARARLALARALQSCIDAADPCPDLDRASAPIRAAKLATVAAETYASLGPGFAREAARANAWRDSMD